MRNKHPLAGREVRLKCADDPDGLNGSIMVVEDWWQNVAGKSWMMCDGNPACLKYALRSAFSGLPTDDEVIYGHVCGMGHLVHQSEIDQGWEDGR